MAGNRKSLFIFLMGLAWKCRFSMPLLLSGTVAVLGRAFMFQIRVHTVHTLHENEVGCIIKLWTSLLASVFPHMILGTLSVVRRSYSAGTTVSSSELAYYEEEDDEQADADSWETGSTDSWETIVEEVAYG